MDFNHALDIGWITEVDPEKGRDQTNRKAHPYPLSNMGFFQQVPGQGIKLITKFYPVLDEECMELCYFFIPLNDVVLKHSYNHKHRILCCSSEYLTTVTNNRHMYLQDLDFRMEVLFMPFK
jgi:hypothetical protein